MITPLNLRSPTTLRYFSRVMVIISQMQPCSFLGTKQRCHLRPPNDVRYPQGILWNRDSWRTASNAPVMKGLSCWFLYISPICHVRFCYPCIFACFTFTVSLTQSTATSIRIQSWRLWCTIIIIRFRIFFPESNCKRLITNSPPGPMSKKVTVGVLSMISISKEMVDLYSSILQIIFLL